MKDIEENLKEFLPHGSGIDLDWDIEDKGKYYKCINSYHYMDEYGYYDGWIDFSVIIPKKDPSKFKVHLHTNGAGWYRAYKCMLLNYFYDIFALSIDDYFTGV